MVNHFSKQQILDFIDKHIRNNYNLDDRIGLCINLKTSQGIINAVAQVLNKTIVYNGSLTNSYSFCL